MNLATTYECKSWNEEIVNEIVSKCVNVVFEKLGFVPNEEDAEVCFLFTDDTEVRHLNKAFRGVDKSTNVLSFPAFSPGEIPLGKNKKAHAHNDYEENLSEDEPCILGSIAVAYETTAREAEEQGKVFDEHLCHLIVHSLLHLLGYDHINQEDAEEMESLEIKILSQMDIKDPYQ